MRSFVLRVLDYIGQIQKQNYLEIKELEKSILTNLDRVYWNSECIYGCYNVAEPPNLMPSQD
jgi:hypothetical protein